MELRLPHKGERVNINNVKNYTKSEYQIEKYKLAATENKHLAMLLLHRALCHHNKHGHYIFFLSCCFISVNGYLLWIAKGKDDNGDSIKVSISVSAALFHVHEQQDMHIYYTLKVYAR